jgi:DNA-binding response OmpR family regulator
LYKILLIDANPSFGTTFSSLLRHSGYQVDVTTSFAEGYDLFNRSGADLLLLGIVGDEDINDKTLKAFADCKVIILCSGGEGQGHATPQKSHINDHLVFYKPFRTEEVLAAIYSALVPRPTPIYKT